MAGKIQIGTSGWAYKEWRGDFYPESLRQADEFEYYQTQFQTVELNNSFYRLPTKETFEHWKSTTNKEFTFSVKASRYITHMKKLKEPIASSSRFFENVAGLGGKLAVVLFQLPPHWRYNKDRLSEFLKAPPKGIRYTFEFRDTSWHNNEVYEMLKNHNCAFCIFDLDRQLSPLEVTADFVYIRLHGPAGKYSGSYSDDELVDWADKCRNWSAEGKDVFVYFDNDIGGHAPHDALRLVNLVEVEG